MARVGTCQGCAARFKIPDSVTATRAKCKKCGGVVDIPAADASAAAADKPAPAPKAAPKPTTLAAAAPSKAPRKAPVKAPTMSAARARTKAPLKAPSKSGARAPLAPKTASGKAPKRSSSRSAAAKGGAAAAGKTSPRRAAAKSAGRSSAKSSRAGKRGSDGDAKQGLPVVPIVIIAVLLAIGAAGYALGWFSSSAEPAPATTSDNTGMDDAAEGGDDDTGMDEPATETGDADMTEDTSAADQEAAAAEVAAAAAEAKKVAAAAAAPKDPDEPLDPMLDFTPFEMLPGTDPDTYARWIELVDLIYIEGSGPRTTRKLMTELYADDVVDQTPAYINAVLGLDMSNGSDIISVYKLVDDWQQRVDHFPRFFFDGDTAKTEVTDVNKRVEVFEHPTNGWAAWWNSKVSDPDKLPEYREKLATRLAAKAANDG